MKGKKGRVPETPDPQEPTVEVEKGSDPPTLTSETAVQILTELSALNDRAIAAHVQYVALRDKTKEAKTKWDDLAEQVQSRLREVTHPPALPLFDGKQAEEDLTRIQEQAATASDAPF